MLSPLKILIFVSFSMPLASLKQLSMEAHKTGAQLVFRGLSDNSLNKTALKVQELGGPALIDPTLFAKYRVKVVPTFVFVRD